MIHAVGLDLASLTGAARWKTGWAAPAFATLRLAKSDDDIGPALRQLDDWLTELHAEDPITHLFAEAPILPRGRVAENEQGRAFVQNFTRIETVAMAFGLSGHIDLFAHDNPGIICRAVPQSSWRKFFIGSSRGSSADLKRKAKAQAKGLGWVVRNDHEAEAGGVLCYGLDCFGTPMPGLSAPLLAGALA